MELRVAVVHESPEIWMDAALILLFNMKVVFSLDQGVELILVQGPHTVQLDVKWAGPVQSQHNYL